MERPQYNGISLQLDVVAIAHPDSWRLRLSIAWVPNYATFFLAMLPQTAFDPLAVPSSHRLFGLSSPPAV